MRLKSGVEVQSILTGESGSVEKGVDTVQNEKAVYQDKTCMLFSVRAGTDIYFLAVRSFEPIVLQMLFGNKGDITWCQ